MLLTPADLQVLPPNAKIGDGAVDTSGAPLGISCTYTWGPRTPEWGQTTLTITVIDTSKAWAGRSPDSIKQSLLAKAKNDGLNASEIAGVGDAAVFRFESRLSSATAESYFRAKALHLSVIFHSGDALPSKDKVIALLKKAAERL